jgi:hypothetical protein
MCKFLGFYNEFIIKYKYKYGSRKEEKVFRRFKYIL